jgi:hypothetical protein
MGTKSVTAEIPTNGRLRATRANTEMANTEVRETLTVIGSPETGKLMGFVNNQNRISERGILKISELTINSPNRETPSDGG